MICGTGLITFHPNLPHLFKENSNIAVGLWRRFKQGFAKITRSRGGQSGNFIVCVIHPQKRSFQVNWEVVPFMSSTVGWYLFTKTSRWILNSLKVNLGNVNQSDPTQTVTLADKILLVFLNNVIYWFFASIEDDIDISSIIVHVQHQYLEFADTEIRV